MIEDFDAYCDFLETMPDAALLVGQDGRIVFANRMTSQLLGHVPGSLSGQPLAVLLPSGTRVGHDKMIASYFEAPRLRPMRTGQAFTALRADDSELAVDIMLQPLQLAGRPMVLSVLRDVSERADMQALLRAALERERALARTDPLTGTANRRHFVEVAQHEMDRLRRYGRAFTLCYIDLDHFKRVNDELGHSVGDQLLCALVETMAAHLRVSDLLARLGGDEFALLLPETAQGGALATMHKLCADVDAMMSARHWPVTLSVGVLTCKVAPPDLDVLVHAADELVYRAKAAGRNAIIAADYPASAAA